MFTCEMAPLQNLGPAPNANPRMLGPQTATDNSETTYIKMAALIVFALKFLLL